MKQTRPAGRVSDRRKRGWFWMDNLVLDEYGSSVGAIAIAVYSVLCRHASNDDRTCYIGIKRLAEKCGVSRNTAKSALHRLESAGLIEVVPRYDGQWQQVNEYVILEPVSGSGDDRGQDMTGVSSSPTLGQDLTDPGSGDGHIKDQSSKDYLVKTGSISLKQLNEWMIPIRLSSHAPSHLVAIGAVSAEAVSAIALHPMLGRELSRLEDERKSKWIPR